MEQEFKNQVIRMAWEDRVAFEEIEKKTGLNEAAVIKLMRSELRPASFRRWRKRVTGRVTKHRRLLEKRLQKGVRVDENWD